MSKGVGHHKVEINGVITEVVTVHRPTVTVSARGVHRWKHETVGYKPSDPHEGGDTALWPVINSAEIK